MALTAKHPLFGLGPDNFVAGYRTAISAEGRIASLKEPFDSTHNWLLYAATSAGLVGLGATLVFIALSVRAGLSLARTHKDAALFLVPLAAYLGQGLVNVNDLTIDWVLWLSAGGIASASGRAIQKAPGKPRAVWWSVVAAVVSLVFTVPLAAYSGERINASRYFKSAVVTAQEGDWNAGLSFARAALAIDSRRAEYWNAFANALAVGGNASAAANAFIDASQRAPWDPGYPRNIALQKVRLGDVAGATRAIEQALQLDPNDSDTLDIDARLTFNRADYNTAAELGERAVRLAPDIVARYEVPVRAYFQLKNFAAAIGLLRQGITTVDDSHLHVLLALAYYGDGHPEDSEREVSRALELNPQSAEAMALRDQLRSAQ